MLFVSHDTGAVGQLCRRAIWLERGRVRDNGPARAILDGYLRDVVADTPAVEIATSDDGPVGELSVAVLDASGVEQSTLRRDEPVRLRIRFRVRRQLPELDVALYLINRSGVRVVNENVSTAGLVLGGPPRDQDVRLTVPPLLPAGDYVVGLWVGNDHETFAHGEALTLSILPLPTDRQGTVHGAMRPAVRWSVEETC